MAENELTYQQRLAQMPPDVLPTMHFVAQLPGMDTREYEELGYEKQRFWFGKTDINGEHVLLGISSEGKTTDFLIAGHKKVESWRLEEDACNRIGFSRTFAASKSLLASEGQWEKPDESRFFPHFDASLNFCSDLKSETPPFCTDCIFKEGANKDLRYPEERNMGFWMGTIDPSHVEPRDFPLRQESDLRERSIEGLRVSEGFNSKLEQAVDAIRTIKHAIINAEMVTIDEATAMLPDVSYPINSTFRSLRPRE